MMKYNFGIMFKRKRRTIISKMLSTPGKPRKPFSLLYVAGRVRATGTVEMVTNFFMFSIYKKAVDKWGEQILGRN